MPSQHRRDHSKHTVIVVRRSIVADIEARRCNIIEAAGIAVVASPWLSKHQPWPLKHAVATSLKQTGCRHNIAATVKVQCDHQSVSSQHHQSNQGAIGASPWPPKHAITPSPRSAKHLVATLLKRSGFHRSMRHSITAVVEAVGLPSSSVTALLAPSHYAYNSRTTLATLSSWLEVRLPSYAATPRL